MRAIDQANVISYANGSKGTGEYSGKYYFPTLEKYEEREIFLSLIEGEPLGGLRTSTFWTDAPSGYSCYRVDSPCSSGFKFLCSDFFLTINQSGVIERTTRGSKEGW